MTNPKRKCTTITARGKRCRNNAIDGSEHCHRPDHQGVRSALRPLGRYYYFRFNPEFLLSGLAEEHPDISDDDFVDMAEEARMDWLSEEMAEMTDRRWELVDEGTMDTCTRVYVPWRSHGTEGSRQALREEHEWLEEHCANYDVLWPNVDPMNWAEETVYKSIMETA